MNPAENHILNQKEPYKSIMLYVRSVILKTLPEIEEKYSYRLPFYYYNKKPFVYLNVLKGTEYVDIAFMQGAFLESNFPQLKDYNNRRKVRSIQVENIEDFNEFEFVILLKEASGLLG